MVSSLWLYNVVYIEVNRMGRNPTIFRVKAQVCILLDMAITYVMAHFNGPGISLVHSFHSNVGKASFKVI